ncbi:hypothetical protein TNIN_489091 [Trichonephila inaurata madagascariensis]|uniref:Uncharacterized protein n=1 Tax=Trichonephila inaurata madagascariensis TaxID=2747483 RepID=A0A8X6YEC7_9ARAC|nr:hypothetical protein TNIN_489091 [Trichonephila inaurata madagascariensis]
MTFDLRWTVTLVILTACLTVSGRISRYNGYNGRRNNRTYYDNRYYWFLDYDDDSVDIPSDLGKSNAFLTEFS